MDFFVIILAILTVWTIYEYGSKHGTIKKLEDQENE